MEDGATAQVAPPAPGVEVLIGEGQVLLERGAGDHRLEGRAGLVLVGERPVTAPARRQVGHVDRRQDFAGARVHEQREAAQRVQGIHRARQVGFEDALEIRIEGEHDPIAILGRAPHAARQRMRLAPPVPDQGRPARVPAQQVVEGELEALDPGVVEVGATHDLLGGRPEQVLALSFDREIHPAPALVGEPLAHLGGHAACDPQEPGLGVELALEATGIEPQDLRERTRGRRRVLHLARRGRNRVGR